MSGFDKLPDGGGHARTNFNVLHDVQPIALHEQRVIGADDIINVDKVSRLRAGSEL